MKGYNGPRRESTMLHWKDDSIITHDDGTITTAMPIPSRQSKVLLDAAKIAEAQKWADELSKAIAHQ